VAQGAPRLQILGVWHPAAAAAATTSNATVFILFMARSLWLCLSRAAIVAAWQLYIAPRDVQTRRVDFLPCWRMTLRHTDAEKVVHFTTYICQPIPPPPSLLL
jgi:hypothetical protein